jgi:small subunit ribosomal protein S1
MAEASEAQGPDQAVSSQPSEGEDAASSAADVSGVAPSASVDAASSGPEDGEPVAQSNGSDAESAAEAQTQSGGTDAGPAEAGSDEAGDDASAAGKRKRRRRKRRKGETESGENEAPAVGEHTDTRARRRDAPAPFLRFFVGAHGGRKHGFSVGEVVAGRVKEIANGSIAVDLFGKAIAYVDEHEPREVPPAPELLREPLVEAQPAATVATTAAAAETQEASSEATSVTAASTENAEPVHVASLDASLHETDATAQSSPDAPREPSSTAVVEAAETGGPEVDLDADVDADGAGETTLAGDTTHAGHGPLPPAPIVPDDYPRPEPPILGQVFRGRVGAVSESGHIALVNRIADRALVLANMQRYRDERRRVQGLVFGFNRGGFDVLVESVRAFCPASAMTLEELDDPTQLLGHKLEFLLPVSQSVTKDIIVSRRSILERLLRKKAKELLRSLEPGQRLKGRVTSVREFGLFVDIGGFEGLVHQSELSFAHGAKPSDVAAVGDEVEVQVLGVGAEPRKGAEGGRKDRLERVSLSIKALLPDPWDAHADALREGTARAAKVTRTTDFGAFVELAPQVEGLLHISELGRDLQHANQAVKEGEEIFVVVERVDKKARRITLSRLTAQEMEEYKASEAAGEERPRSVRPGSRIKVKVTKAESRGLLVRVSGVLGKRARGYVPSSELVGERGDLRKAYPVGRELEVKIVSLDRDGGLRCSVKALEVDDERRAVKDYRREAAKQGFGTFGDLLRAKLGQSDSK